MKVTICREDRIVGTVTLIGGILVGDTDVARRVLSRPIVAMVNGGMRIVEPDEAELFLENLWQEYKSPYFSAGRAV